MNLRAMTREDLNELYRIHNKFYKDEFEFPDFQRQFLNAFVIEHDGTIVTAGGVRKITEAVAITNKELSIIERADGLRELLGALIYTAHSEGFHEIHAFIQDENWKKVLLKSKFKRTKGEALVFSF